METDSRTLRASSSEEGVGCGARPAGEGARFGGFLAVGKSKAKVYVETDTRVTFQDVAGVDEAKSELEEVVAFLKDPGSHGRLGARMLGAEPAMGFADVA